MATIIYGVSGEGSGHSSRARAMITHLEEQGHRVHVATYGRGYDNLKGDFSVLEIEGLHITADDNRVHVVKTLMDNIARLHEGPRALARLKKLFTSASPDCVITDFEPMTAYLANHYDLPLITIDNQHRMRYMAYPCPRNLRKDALVAETVIRAMIPRPDVSLVTTFYFGGVKNERTFLVPPIVRREVLETTPVEGRHILVYLTQGFESLIERLVEFPREEFRVYGSVAKGQDEGERSDVKAAEGRGEGGRGRLVFKPFSRSGFLDDLAACRAVIATAGFTLLTESLHLRKPYLALPMKGQFEQELNGLLLARLGYGKNCRRVTAEALGDFLYRVPEYREKLNDYTPTDNGEITARLDQTFRHRLHEHEILRSGHYEQTIFSFLCIHTCFNMPEKGGRILNFIQKNGRGMPGKKLIRSRLSAFCQSAGI